MKHLYAAPYNTAQTPQTPYSIIESLTIRKNGLSYYQIFKPFQAQSSFHIQRNQSMISGRNSDEFGH